MIHLYIKQHNTTGLKYFGKTTRPDPYSYIGSGKYWKAHIKSHGRDISTISVWSFDNVDDCEKFALQFSADHKIVESSEWANLKPENGRDGIIPGWKGMLGKDNPMYGKVKEENPFYGKHHSAATIALYKKQKARSNNPRAKPVMTPVGRFECLIDASEALGIGRETLRKRLNSAKDGYYFI
jgi:hypothetical protein